MFVRINDIARAFQRRLLQMLHLNARAHHLTSNGATSVSNSDGQLFFATLSRQEQLVVVRYLTSVAELLGLLNGIRSSGRAVDHPSVLKNFAKGEADYVSLGFMPFIPGALKASGLTSLEPEAIDRSRLVRRSAGENYACFAQAMSQQVERLLRSGNVVKLDSRVAQQRLKDLCDASQPERSDWP